MASPRVLFFGYSEVGYATLELLLTRQVNVVGVFTHEANPQETAWFRSVPGLAQTRGLPVFTPESLKDPIWEEHIRKLQPDLILSMYYRNMIPMRLLDLAPLGAFNMHGSYLPRYRGRAPLNWAIIHGEDHTGVSLHVMVKEADAGDLVDQEKISIGPNEAVTTVLPRIPEAAVGVLMRQIDALLAGRAVRHPQDHTQATYFGKRTPEDGRINWKNTDREIFNLVRAITRPFPGAFTDAVRDGKTTRLQVWQGHPKETSTKVAESGTILSLSPLVISCGSGAFEITEFSWIDPLKSDQIGDPPIIKTGEKIA